MARRLYRRTLTVVGALSRALPLRCGFVASLCNFGLWADDKAAGWYVRRSGLWGNLDAVDSR